MGALSLSRLRRGLESPNLFLREANRLYHRRGYTRPYNTAGVDVFAEDWDNLIVLDACRYDMFADQSSLPGRLESRVSRGSNTVEFLAGNVAGRSLLDAVYVTANPQLRYHREAFEPELHATIDVWEADGWDERYHTVLPETMTERTKAAAEEFPDKRLVSHFIQPHYPFLTDEDVFENGRAFRDRDKVSCWQQVMTGELPVSPEAVWAAYRETLDRTLPAVAELLNALDGKTVVTADHGNMIGERARPVPVTEWGHPQGIYTEELVRVPWLVDDDDDRREIVAEEPVAPESEVDEGAVADRLEQLGYT